MCVYTPQDHVQALVGVRRLYVCKGATEHAGCAHLQLMLALHRPLPLSKPVLS